MEDEEAEDLFAFIASRPLTILPENFGIDPKYEFKILASQNDEKSGREAARKIASKMDLKLVSFLQSLCDILNS